MPSNLKYPLEALHTKKMGQGPIHLLLLHGWAQTSDQMHNLANLLCPYCTVHLIDLPGFGRSSSPTTPWTIADYADLLLHYLENQKIQSATIAGHSFGGKIGLQMAATSSKQVSKLIMIASSALLRKRPFQQKIYRRGLKYLGITIKLLDKLTKKSVYKNWFIPKFGSPDYLNSQGVLRKILVGSVNCDLTSLAKNLKTDTLLLWAAHDTETPLEIGKRLHKLLPNSQLKVFPFGDHDLVKDSSGHLCAYYIRSFLNLRGTSSP